MAVLETVVAAGLGHSFKEMDCTGSGVERRGLRQGGLAILDGRLNN